MTFLQAFKKFVILLNTTQGFQDEQVQKPAEHNDNDGETDLPCQGCLWPPPDHGQCQRAYATKREDNKSGSEIPR